MVHIVLKIAAICLLFTNLVINVEADEPPASMTSSVFADLSESEMIGVMVYLNQLTIVSLSNPLSAKLTDATIFLIEALRPDKEVAKRYLDGVGPKPERAARVIIYRGDLPTPQIQEYRVSPIPNPTQHALIQNPKWKYPINYNARSFTALQQLLPVVTFLEKELSVVNDLLLNMTGGYSYVNCAKNCLSWYPGLPAGNKPGEYRYSICLLRQVGEGTDLHPVGLEFTVNSDSLDPSQWYVEHVWLQGQTFTSFSELRNSYMSGLLQFNPPLSGQGLSDAILSSTLNLRGNPKPSEPKRGPRSSMPDGRRFSVDGRRIKWMGWDFEFSMLSSTGIQLHNIKFLGDRIAWELSLQEIAVFYGGGSPVPKHNTYFDSFAIFGVKTAELLPEIDCPKHAEFFDFVHFYFLGPYVFKNGACVFELDQGLPLRRHSWQTEDREKQYAQGLTSNVLVLRQILTVDNYDYILDFVFYQGGQVQGKVSLSGYVLSSYYTGPEMDKYGHVVNGPRSIANIHHHICNLKADLDIRGEANRFETLDIKLESIPDELNEGDTLLNHYFERSLKQTEKEAAYQFDFSTPKYLVIYNNNTKNKFGNPQGYRILSEGMSKMLLPEQYRGFRSRAWANYQVAVTKFHEDERSSSSIYTSMEQFDPAMSFQDYIDDNEDIVDEDLVAWITLGTHHIPHSEDVPIVSTPGVQLSFFLLPYNYFDEDPSMASRDNIRVELSEDGNHKYEYAGVPGNDEDTSTPEDKTSTPDSVTNAPNKCTSGACMVQTNWLLISLVALAAHYLYY